MGWRESLDLLDHCLSGVDLNKEKERKVTNLNAKAVYLPDQLLQRILPALLYARVVPSIDLRDHLVLWP